MNFVSILISLCLSAVIVGGTMHWVVLVKQQWEKAQQRKIDQNIQKVVFQFLYQDLQAGGYRGIRTQDNSAPLYRHYSDYTGLYRYFRFDQTVFAFTATPGNCFGKMPYTACERIHDNTEAIIIYNVPKGYASLTSPMKQQSDPLITADASSMQENSLMLVSDYEEADAFILTSIEGNALHHKKVLGKNDSAELSKLYGENAEVVELQTVAYYLGVPERSKDKKAYSMDFVDSKNSKDKKVKSGESGLSLYRDDFLHPAQELVSGITNLNFTCAVEKTVSISNVKYLKPNEVTNWAAVKSVRIEVVTGSGKTWETTVVLRNNSASAI